MGGGETERDEEERQVAGRQTVRETRVRWVIDSQKQRARKGAR